MSHPQFEGRTLVIATMHNKQQVLAPILEKELGCTVVVPENFDTDQFGTFTKEVARAGDQLEAARAKAQCAMEITGADLVLASEGSFGAHPNIPFVQSNLELLVLIDTKHNQEILASYRTQDTNSTGEWVSSPEEAYKVAEQIGFPEYGVVVRAHPEKHTKIYKDISSFEELQTVVSSLLSNPFRKRVYIESDMRAFRNPRRMEAIAHTGRQLIANIQSICPKCQAAGFVAVDYRAGLACIQCGMPTDMPLVDVYRCALCDYQEERRVEQYGEYAKSDFCDRCNP